MNGVHNSNVKTLNIENSKVALYLLYNVFNDLAGSDLRIMRDRDTHTCLIVGAGGGVGHGGCPRYIYMTAAYFQEILTGPIAGTIWTYLGIIYPSERRGRRGGIAGLSMGLTSGKEYL